MKLYHLLNHIKNKGMTITEFAKKVGVCRRTVHYWIKGDVQPHKNKLERIVEVLGLNVSQFFILTK